MKKIIYWSPHINSQIATVKAVLNSAKSFSHYEKNYDVYIVNVFGEWTSFETQCKKSNIKFINLTNYNFNLPINGFIKSRLFYIFISIISLLKLPLIIDKIKPDYFIAHLIVSPILFISKFFKYKTKFILRISGLPKFNLFRIILWKSLSKKLFAITCPTLRTRIDLIKHKIIDEKKIFVLEDPILKIKNLSKNKKNNNISRGFVLSIGRLTYQKNFEFLIKNYSKLAKEINYKKLFIIGSGEYKAKLERLIIIHKASSFIKILDYTKNINQYYRNADCFILTSRWEDPGFVLIEAAANNLPILSSDCPNGPKEFLNDEINGYSYSNNNEKEFKLKFLDLIQNIKSEKVFKKKIAAKKYIKKFTVFAHYLKLKKILN